MRQITDHFSGCVVQSVACVCLRVCPVDNFRTKGPLWKMWVTVDKITKEKIFWIKVKITFRKTMCIVVRAGWQTSLKSRPEMETENK